MTDAGWPLLTLQMNRHAQLDANADTKRQDRTHTHALEEIQLHAHMSRIHLENNKNKEQT